MDNFSTGPDLWVELPYADVKDRRMARSGHRSRIRLLVRVIAGAAAAGTLLAPTWAAVGSVPAGEPVRAAVWPLDPHPVLAAYDPPGCIWCEGHRGVDIGALPLAPVRAAIAGEVTYAGTLAGRGVLVVDDGTRRVTYEPVAAAVRRGATVEPGDVVGTLELVGSHCHPDACLHLGLIDDATAEYLDPLSLFSEASGPVRLLPLWIDQRAASLLGPLGDLF